MSSQLTKKQVKTFTKTYVEDNTTYRIIAKVRYDDECGNGHNTFAITADIDRQTKNGKWIEESGGCLHDEIAKHFPELEKFIKWHLASSKEPFMYYVANTLFWAEKAAEGGMKRLNYRTMKEEIEYSAEKCLEFAKKTAVWLDADDSEFLPDPATDDEMIKDVETVGFVNPNPAKLKFNNLKQKLLDRLPTLMAEFKSDVESLGFTW